MAWDDLESDVADEFTSLEGRHDPAAGLTLLSRGQSASEAATRRTMREDRRALIWHQHLERGDIPGRCTEAGCHNLLAPTMDRLLERHCSEDCRTGVERKRLAAAQREEQRTRLLRLWDDAGTRLWQRKR
jgi:hypothetical protein